MSYKKNITQKCKNKSINKINCWKNMKNRLYCEPGNSRSETIIYEAARLHISLRLEECLVHELSERFSWDYWAGDSIESRAEYNRLSIWFWSDPVDQSREKLHSHRRLIDTDTFHSFSLCCIIIKTAL